MRAEAYVEKAYRETPLGGKYSATTIATDTGLKRTIVAQILLRPYMLQLRAADKKMSGGMYRKLEQEPEQLSLF